jgi:hypothetical protein
VGSGFDDGRTVRMTLAVLGCLRRSVGRARVHRERADVVDAPREREADVSGGAYRLSPLAGEASVDLTVSVVPTVWVRSRSCVRGRSRPSG